MQEPLITAIILAYNEERNIRRCIESIHGWCDIAVVDSYSTDKTIQVAEEYGAQLYSNKYSNHAAQWNWALENVMLSTPWILALDADFIVTLNLKNEISAFLHNDQSSYNGFYVKHEYVFWGSRIRFGGIKKFWLRGLRKNQGKADTSDLVDFRFNVNGKTKQLKGVVIEDNEKDNDFSFWVQKQDVFSLRLAVEEELRRRKLLEWEGKNSLLGNTDEKFKKLRDLWLRMPLFFRPWMYFVYRYFISLGILDGKGGFIYHFQQGLWLRIVIDMKILEIRRARLSNQELIEVSQKMLVEKSGSFQKILAEMKKNIQE